MGNKKTWRCLMCGISLEKAVKQEFNPLEMSVDDYLDDKLDNRINQYRWDRQCKHPKQTCSKSCGYNLSSHKRTLEPKSSYVKESFKCDCCGTLSDGGRLLVSGTKSRFRVCRACHRRKITNELRRLWEVYNKDHRLKYQRQWRKENPKKAKAYKRRYLKRLAKGQTPLGKTRKITCAANPGLML